MPPPEVCAGHDHGALSRCEQSDRFVYPTRCGRFRLGVGQRRSRWRLLALGEDDVEREVDEGRAGVRRKCRSQRFVDQPGYCVGTLGRGGELRQRRDKRNVVDLLERPHPPAQGRRTAAKNHDRRLILQRRADRAKAVGNARARCQRGNSRLARDLSPTFGGEGRCLLVAGIDNLDPLLAAAVVDREEVAAGEREQLRHSVLLEAPRYKAAAVEVCCRTGFSFHRATLPTIEALPAPASAPPTPRLANLAEDQDQPSRAHPVWPRAGEPGCWG
ncbi:unannotated protein [freshwater metagenome]|uniref:Unannotated protein n=1 Tax=freshwater metagenome TaxID=449393 RepID=A0A6J7S1N3_9ZZZZ